MANPLTATASTATRSTATSPASSSAVDATEDSSLVSVAAKAEAKARAQFNAAVVSSSLSVSLQSGNDPQSVVLTAALNGINEALKGEFGEDAIQNAMAQDNTPSGTAGRIVSLSTAFYQAYKQQHPGAEESTTLKNFMDTLKSGVEQGFKEAREVLQGLGVLNGDIASNIDKTYELVQQGYADFASAQQDRIQQAASGASQPQPKAA